MKRKRKIPMWVRRRMCLWTSGSCLIVSILGMFSAIGACELDLIGAGKMIALAFLSLGLSLAFGFLTAVIAVKINEIESQRTISNIRTANGAKRA